MDDNLKQKMKEGRERAKEARDNAKTETETQPSGDKVMIEKSFLEDIRKTMDELKADNAMLKQVADKSRMSDFYTRNKGKMPEQYKLRMIDGKVILGWKMIKDDVYIDGPRVVENQVILLIFENGESKEISYKDFVRLYTTTTCSKLESRTDKDDNLILKLERNDDKRTFEVDVRFVN
jgi:hypothetical protein